MDVVGALESAYEHGQEIFDGVTAEQLDQPTPCPQFEVRALVAHVLGVMDMITAGIGGEAARPPEGDRADRPGDAFRAASRRSLAASQRGGRSSRSTPRSRCRGANRR